MKAGYSVEGSTDRAFLRGLRDRWCPAVELVEGRFRGRSGQSQRREIPKTCIELSSKGAELIILMRDANDEYWRDVLKADSGRCADEHRHFVVFAVCDRNIECWLCADRNWIAYRTGRAATEFAVANPKVVFESAMQITTFEKREDEIASMVRAAPLHRWLSNKSFEAFYESLRQMSKDFTCRIENLRDHGNG
ncbi:MAG: hypothetical protein V2B18_09935 [Pseudomonadota bacterium]